MNLDDLKVQWRAEMQIAQNSDLRFDQLEADVSKFGREVGFSTWATIITSITGCVLAIIFGWLTQEDVRSEQKLAIIAYGILTIWMTYCLIKARPILRSDAWTLRARLELEMERLRRQRILWKNGGLVIWLPLLVYFGLSLPLRLFPAAVVMCALVFCAGHWTVARRIDPLLSRLTSVYEELLESEPQAP